MWASENVKRWAVCRPSWEVACDSRSCPAEMVRAANASSKLPAILYRAPLIAESEGQGSCNLMRVDPKRISHRRHKVPPSRLFGPAAVNFQVGRSGNQRQLS